jgi:predicted SnoaL-like aldol condensation-catalyzing enzyme
MLTELWSKGNPELVADFYAESYVQHNPDMPGGYARIRQVVENDIRRYIEITGGPFPVDVHHVGAEGDIVFVHLSLFMAGINRNDGDRSTNVDIFRVDRHGRMVEHWDVLQIDGVALPPTATVF